MFALYVTKNLFRHRCICTVKHLKAKKYAHINADVRQKGEEMTPKEYLTQGYRIEDRIKSLRRELKRLREDVPIANYESIGFSSDISSAAFLKTQSKTRSCKVPAIFMCLSATALGTEKVERSAFELI